MSKGKSIIPDFMSNNPHDTFKFLFPLKLILDEDKFGNSHYKVVIKNMTQNEVFTHQVSPELLFTHFPLYKSFKNGEKTEYYPSKEILEKVFTINSSLINNSVEKKLNELLDEKTIGTLLGWSYKYLDIAKYINCYLIEQDNIKIIIPHFAIGIYYYFRFSEMREAVLDCNIESLYVMCDDNRSNAKVVLPTPRTDEDAAFIHRYACQSKAHNEFENISKYIHHYLKYMREHDLDEEIDGIHLKINFPVKEKFKIDTRVSLVTNKETNKDYYFIHEITNDNSDIGFDKFTKIIEQNKIITDFEDLENLSKVDREIPEETTEILKVKDANKKHTSTQHRKDRKKSCGSLVNIEIEHKTQTKDIIKDLLKIYQEQENNDKVDQSLTESSSKGDKTTRRVIISSEFDKEETRPLNEIDNFVVFRQYMEFLNQQFTIKNFMLSEVKNLPEFLIEKDEEKKINPKCKINKRTRQYLTSTFKYENFYVGLLELENHPSSAASSWVIVSDSVITNNTFDFFINLYFKDNNSIPDIAKNYKKTNPKFTKKNHERNENLDEIQLAKWYAGLLGKINL